MITTPIKYLKSKKKEITDQYNYALSLEYISLTKAKKKAIELFNKDKKSDLAKIKLQLDKYNQAIKILVAVKNNTF